MNVEPLTVNVDAEGEESFAAEASVRETLSMIVEVAAWAAPHPTSTSIAAIRGVMNSTVSPAT